MPEDTIDYDRFHLDDQTFTQPSSPPFPAQTKPRRPAYASNLRRELKQRALDYARLHRLAHFETPNAVLFGPPLESAHANFHPASYEAILASSAWSSRLLKAHTAHRRFHALTEWKWRELDSASSSDALLMNIFCYPGALDAPATQALLGIAPGLCADFGYHPQIPFTSGRFDRTEIDLRIGSLLIEAKLTESNFQTAKPALLRRYRDLEEVFGPLDQTLIHSYQLLRGALAAHAEPTIPPATFCVLADARRPDLLEAWYAVMSAVRLHDLRCRLQMLTWQELAATLPGALQSFLEEKYGITPA